MIASYTITQEITDRLGAAPMTQDTLDHIPSFGWRLIAPKSCLRSVFQIGFVVVAQDAKSGSRDVFHREAQMSKTVLARRRCPKALHTNNRTLVARPTMPSYR